MLDSDPPSLQEKRQVFFSIRQILNAEIAVP